MKRLLVFISFLIIICQVFAFSQPKIEIEGNDVYDWGKIDPQGKPLIADVKIFNKGTDTLRITNVKPGCGCTTAPLDKYNIEPGGFANMKITLKVSNDGPVQKSIRISSNDVLNPTKTLYIKADITPPISISHKALTLMNMELNKESFASSNIKNNSKDTLKILEVTTEPENLKAKIEKTIILPNQEVVVDVQYTPTTNSTLSGKINIKTNYVGYELINIYVRGVIKSE